ncbi:MAG: DUF1553 domain-containing protein [Spirochaetes bacterium]|nr:DUF1553 domain-containing protein [Spirochaetota bacterium]
MHAQKPVRPPVDAFESETLTTPLTAIDRHVFAKLAKTGARPTYMITDEVFLRRAYLDTTGSLPSVGNIRKFIADKSTNKRALVIDELLNSEGFVSYQTMRWCDILRVKSEFPINLWPNAVQAYQRWIRTAIQNNQPYDQFARDLLTASGDNFRDPPVNFYRALSKKDPVTIAQAVGLTFMGVRAEKWSNTALWGMAAFFTQVAYKATAEWKQEIVFWDPDRAVNAPDGKPFAPVFPGGKKAVLMPNVDPRVQFADWLITKENPYFARNIVNRIWYWHMGRGIVSPPDDMRPDNPPQNPELLDYLAAELVSHQYDLKHIYRLILNSGTYQQSSIPLDADNKETNFSFYLTRRLDAEVIIDILNKLTGTTESYSSPIPEPFTYLPNDQAAVDIADGSITSSFLEMFGRPTRDNGQAEERNNTPTPDQRLHMLNSSMVQDKLRTSAVIRKMMLEAKVIDKQLEVLYLAILSRRPSDEEKKVALDYFIDKSRKPVDSLSDITWALVNTTEFITKH